MSFRDLVVVPLHIFHFLYTDVNECNTNNGGCEQYCLNTRGSHYCSCRPGYSLNDAGRECEGMSMVWHLRGLLLSSLFFWRNAAFAHTSFNLVASSVCIFLTHLSVALLSRLFATAHFSFLFVYHNFWCRVNSLMYGLRISLTYRQVKCT